MEGHANETTAESESKNVEKPAKTVTKKQPRK